LEVWSLTGPQSKPQQDAAEVHELQSTLNFALGALWLMAYDLDGIRALFGTEVAPLARRGRLLGRRRSQGEGLEGGVVTFGGALCVDDSIHLCKFRSNPSEPRPWIALSELGVPFLRRTP
jgi:hypothetical protein